MAGEDLEFELAHPYGRAWWEEVRENVVLPAELVKFIDDGLAKASYNYPLETFDRIQENAKKKKESNQSEP